MPDPHQHHEELIRGIGEQLKPVLEHSPQAVYVYLDDVHKLCNKKFADLLGYASPKAWAEVDAPLADVAEDDQQSVIDAYWNASRKLIASQLDIRLKHVKTGKLTKARMIMVPMPFSGHIMVLHFLSRS